MERRWVGLVVVIAVLVGGLVAGRLLGPGATGTPVAESPPGPPTVGDCLLSREALPFWTVDNAAAGTPPTARIAPCEGDRFGEVVSVLEAPPGRQGPELTPACAAATVSYLGLRTDPATDEVAWSVASAFLILVSGPDPRQRAVGQQWATCLVSPGWQTIDPGIDAAVVRVPRSLRGAFDDEDLRNRLGYCTFGPPGAGWQVACDRPHDTQAFGYAALATEMSRVDLERSCTDWVSRLTGLPDPTDDGTITITTVVYDRDTGNTITAERLPPASSVECSASVSADRLLAGSLLGLDGGPIPWAP